MRRLALLLALASPLPAQEFEVASIKAATDDGHHHSDSDQGTYRVHNLTLKGLIAAAWDLDETEVFGGPVWVDSDGWDISAKIPAEYTKRTPDQFLAMIQRLLIERFQLAIHREPRQISGYAVVVTKIGPGMAVAGPDQIGSDFRSNNTHLKATNVTMDGFARRLSRDRDIAKVVVDKTGLTGKFDSNSAGPGPTTLRMTGLRSSQQYRNNSV